MLRTMRSGTFHLFAVAALLAVQACDQAKTPAPARDDEQNAVPKLSERSSRPAAARIVAIGDLHGDLAATRAILRAAGAIGDADQWTGGSLVVVQTGDQIDRGADDKQVLDLFEKLKSEAKRDGGEVIALSGNHEIMNAQFDFRYVVPEAWAAFDNFSPTGPQASRAARFGPDKRGRASAFAPGGVYATMLAERPLVVRVGGNVFAHGGVHKKHVTYGIDRINDGVREWLAGRIPEPPAIAVADDGPLWTRAYSDGSLGPQACATVSEVLAKLEAKRMIIGHTVQETGVTSACDGKVWRIDVGMCRHYGGPIQAIEIAGDEVKVLEGRR